MADFTGQNTLSSGGGSGSTSVINSLSLGVQEHDNGAGTVTPLENLYSVDGTLTADRIVDAGGNALTIQNVDPFSVPGICDQNGDTCFEVERSANDDTLRGKANGTDVFTFTDQEQLIEQAIPAPLSTLRYEQQRINPATSDAFRLTPDVYTLFAAGTITAPFRTNLMSLERNATTRCGVFSGIGNNGGLSAGVFLEREGVSQSVWRTNSGRAIGYSRDAATGNRTYIMLEPNRIRIRDGAQSEGSNDQVLTARPEVSQQQWRYYIGDESTAHYVGNAGFDPIDNTLKAIAFGDAASIPGAYDKWLRRLGGGLGGGSIFEVGVNGAGTKGFRKAQAVASFSIQLNGGAVPTTVNVYEFLIWELTSNAVLLGGRRLVTLSPQCPATTFSLVALIPGGTGRYEVRAVRVSGTEDAEIISHGGHISFDRMA